jgi:HEAT repeat protein
MKELADGLEHFDYKARLRTIAKLEEVGSVQAAELITKVLDDEDWEVQIRALQALGKMKHLEVTEDVAKSAIHGDIIRVRRAATQALYDMAIPDIVKKLIKATGKSREKRDKVRALEAAARLATEYDVDALVAQCGNRDKNIRAAAFAALSATKNPEAVKYLVKGLKDKTITARVRAAESLGRLGGDTAFKELVDFVLAEPDPYIVNRVSRVLRLHEAGTVARYVAGRASGEKNAERRARTVELLSWLKTGEAGKSLVPFLDDPDAKVRAWAAKGIWRARYEPAVEKLKPLMLGDPDDTVRYMVLEALVRLVDEDKERLDLLVKGALEGKQEMQIRCCVHLKQEGEVAIVEQLYPLVGREGWRLPTAAIITIGHLGHTKQVDVLAARVRDRDWRIRAAVMESLGNLRSMKAVPHLIEGLTDKDPVVKSAALKNLQILAQQSHEPDPEWWRKWFEKNKDMPLTKKGHRGKIEDDYYAKPKYLIEILNKAQIVCVLGKWDHAEIVLSHLGIKSTDIVPSKIESVGLNPKQLLLLNCEGSVGKKGNIERIQWFAHVGGYIVATDWALQNAVVRAFPGFVDRHSKSKTGNDVVVIEPADLDHPLLRGVFDEMTEVMWWLEVIAYPMQIHDPFRTEILVDSLEMLQKYHSSPMATVFDYGHGKVETCVSHFYLQEEGFAQHTTKEDRMRFVADNLGVAFDRIRKLNAERFFDGAITEEKMKELAPDYSMFRLIVNFVVEKRRQVERQ